ncbi:MAG: alpha/beta fold hydrolase [Gammaproteobacteria bacterium]|nr:alpha/beta fold hydrolase [Gammaproteobacteria bacterium]NIP89387.1 alpha/beta fold hydrolase [Gammaproteobacteria bacterium]NIR24221.1 alpha/beta fold hydrolase [Gammaproteobacteria bacterium]NIS05890.1 alpha/beta fold hydrolase [Gammaproteobacteria bacterium]NIU41128.1 alpha/beta fold hydrolase [Gammaproteobacteria bacterium]
MHVNLSYKSQGAAGSPIIILHGLLGSSSNWRSIARRLAERHRVLCLDLRNHGDSPHADDMSYPAMAGDVRAFMDTHDIDTATVIGHSMGGKTAMRLALESPGRVARLVVVDIAPSVSEHDHLPVLHAMASLDTARVVRRADAERLLEPQIADAGMRMFVLQNLVSTPRGFEWRIDLGAIERNLPALRDFPVEPAMAPFDGAALFVRGALSDYVRDSDEALIRRLFPHAEIVTVEDAGHWLHAEQPERFLEILGVT